MIPVADKFGTRSGAARAAVLLEVLVTVTLIVMFMAMIGSQILSSLRAADTIERKQTAMLLAESLSGRLQAGAFEPTDEQMEGDFGETYPGWTWRITIQPTDDEELMRVSLHVFYEDPEVEVVATETPVPALSVHTLWPMPPQMDLVSDFGLTEEQAIALADAVPIEGFDVNNFSPQLLLEMDRDTLLELLPTILEALRGGGLSDLVGSVGGLGSLGGRRGGRRPRTGDRGGGQDSDESGRGAFDMNEVLRMLQNNDRDAAIEYIQGHVDEEDGGGRRERPRRTGRRRVDDDDDADGASRGDRDTPARRRRVQVDRDNDDAGGDTEDRRGRRRPRRVRSRP